MKTVFTSVVCDLFHIGHLHFLKQAKALGDYLIVGVLTDDVVATYKRRPVIPLEQRIVIVESLRFVDLTMVQTRLDPREILDACGADVIVHGDDWKDDFPGAEYMRSIGKEAINVPYYHPQSTSKIIAKIKEEA